MMDTPSMLMINIVPVFEDRVDFAVSEIRRQAREVGLHRFALSMSFHPEGTPAHDKIGRLVSLIHQVKEGLAGTDIELGVLIQSTMGHGWNGKVPLTRERWQRMVRLDGSESPRMCPLDPDFADYVYDCISAVAHEKVAFMLVDDDFGLRERECFCPLHIAVYNEALGKDYTFEDYQRMFEERPWDDSEVMTVSSLRRDTVLPLARMIRAAIDEVDPEMRCGYCTPYAGHGFVQDVALALAGKTRPFVRVNNAVYGMAHRHAFYGVVFGTHRIRYQMPDIPDVIDEADTFPQNYYSESAAAFHTHVTLAFLDGLAGCKLWTSEFDNPVDTGSQRDYEKRLHDYMPFYREIHQAVDRIQWKGVSEMLYRPKAALHPTLLTRVHPEQDWNAGLIGPLGFPIRYDAPSATGIYAMSLKEAREFSDEEIKTLLSGAILIDSVCAKALTARGFGPYMGVNATDGGDDFTFSEELDVETGLCSWMMWEDDHAKLVPLADDVQSATYFVKGRARSGAYEKVAPGMTFYNNSLGGRVVVTGWTPSMPFYKTTRPQRRVMLQRALDFLEGAPFEMGVETGRQFLVRHGIMKNGLELLAFVNLSFDAFDSVPIRLVRNPAFVEKLLPSGEWEQLEWKRINEEQVDLAVKSVICEPVICRFTF